MLNKDRTNADHQTDADCHDHGNPKNETGGGTVGFLTIIKRALHIQGVLANDLNR